MNALRMALVVGLAVSIFGSTHAEAKWSGSRGFAGYGNWCGAGGKGKPIDEADEICYQHDKCFSRAEKRGMITKDYASIGPCHCDRTFLRKMSKVLPKLKKRYSFGRYLKAKRHVLFMLGFFKLRKCIRSKRKVCKKAVKMVKVKKCTKILGRHRCIDTPALKKYRKCGYKFRFGKGGR